MGAARLVSHSATFSCSVTTMAGKKPVAAPQLIEPKEFASASEIDRGIAKLQRRIADVQALDPTRIRSADQSVKNVETGIQETIREIYGQNSPEFQKHKHHDIWSGGYNLMDSDYSMQQKFAEGIPQSIAMLQGLITRLEEKKMDFAEDPRGVAAAALNGLTLHPRLASICVDRYRNGQYEDAVLSASKSLVNFVKEKSGRDDLDGANLMRTVFSPNNPILAFSDLSDQTDQDEQEGMMYLYLGVVLGLRNPTAHAFPVISPERALEYIALVNLLMSRLEETTLRHS
jgi:uncharacterized protein (TIGR02391 family)